MGWAGANVEGVSLSCSERLLLGPTQTALLMLSLPKKAQAPAVRGTPPVPRTRVGGSLGAHLGLTRDLGEQHTCPCEAKVQ